MIPGFRVKFYGDVWHLCFLLFYSNCCVGRNTISFTSTSSGWLIAKATACANVSAGSAIGSTRLRTISAMSGSLMLFRSSVATEPGEITVVRMLYGFTSCRSPSASTRTACLVAA